MKICLLLGVLCVAFNAVQAYPKYEPEGADDVEHVPVEEVESLPEEPLNDESIAEVPLSDNNQMTAQQEWTQQQLAQYQLAQPQLAQQMAYLQLSQQIAQQLAQQRYLLQAPQPSVPAIPTLPAPSLPAMPALPAMPTLPGYPAPFMYGARDARGYTGPSLYRNIGKTSYGNLMNTWVTPRYNTNFNGPTSYNPYRPSYSVPSYNRALVHA